MKINVKSNIKEETNYWTEITKVINYQIKNAADDTVYEMGEFIKNQLLNLIASRPYVTDKDKLAVNSILNEHTFLKMHIDILKALYKEDISKVLMHKDGWTYHSGGLDSPILTIQDNHLRHFMSITQGTTTEEVFSRFVDALNNNVWYDSDSKRFFILAKPISKDYEAEGIKIFCSPTHGINPLSDRVLNKYKTGDRKIEGVLSGQLGIPLSMKGEYLEKLIKERALYIDDIAASITNSPVDPTSLPFGDVQREKAYLRYAGGNIAKFLSPDYRSEVPEPNNWTELAREARRIQLRLDEIRLDELGVNDPEMIKLREEYEKNNSELPEDTQNLINAVEAIKEVTTNKVEKKDSVKYNLDVKLNEEVNNKTTSKNYLKSDDIFNQVYPALLAYIPDIEEKVVRSIVDGITKAVESIGKSK